MPLFFWSEVRISLLDLDATGPFALYYSIRVVARQSQVSSNISLVRGAATVHCKQHDGSMEASGLDSL